MCLFPRAFTVSFFPETAFFPLHLLLRVFPIKSASSSARIIRDWRRDGHNPNLRRDGRFWVRSFIIVVKNISRLQILLKWSLVCMLGCLNNQRSLLQRMSLRNSKQSRLWRYRWSFWTIIINHFQCGWCSWYYYYLIIYCANSYYYYFVFPSQVGYGGCLRHIRLQGGLLED